MFNKKNVELALEITLAVAAIVLAAVRKNQGPGKAHRILCAFLIFMYCCGGDVSAEAHTGQGENKQAEVIPIKQGTAYETGKNSSPKSVHLVCPGDG